MPIDQKRINGPEVSIPYHIYSNSNHKNVDKKYDFTERKDKRTNSEIRKICKILYDISFLHY